MKNAIVLGSVLLLSSPCSVVFASDEWSVQELQDLCGGGGSGDGFWDEYPSEVLQANDLLSNQADQASPSSTFSHIHKATKILMGDKGLSADELKRLCSLLESLQPDVATLLSSSTDNVVEQLQERANSQVVYEASAAHLALGLLFYGNNGVPYDSNRAMHHLQESFRHIGNIKNEWYCFCPSVLCLMGLLYARHDHFDDNQDHKRAFECFALAHQSKKALLNHCQHQQEEMEHINQKIHDVSTWASAQIYTPWFLAFDTAQAALNDSTQRYRLRMAGLLLSNDLYLMWAAAHGDAEAAYKLACDIQEKDVAPYYNNVHQNMHRGINPNETELGLLLANANKAMEKFNQAHQSAQQELTQYAASSSQRFTFDERLVKHRRERLAELSDRATRLVEILGNLRHNLGQQSSQ